MSSELDNQREEFDGFVSVTCKESVRDSNNLGFVMRSGKEDFLFTCHVDVIVS